MDKRSAMLVSGGLVVALMAGTVAREVTLKGVAAAAPVRIVVQTAGSTGSATTALNQESLR